MLEVVEPLSLRERCLRDIAKVALLALLVVPVYLLLNHYWQSLLRLVALYAVLILVCLRLAEVMHHLFRRLPAEIPPWHTTSRKAPDATWLEARFGAADSMRRALQDPQYVQVVLKPRLQRLLMHRFHYPPETPIDALDEHQMARIHPKLLAFLRRREPTGFWARYGCRRQRFNDVGDSLGYLEAL